MPRTESSLVAYDASNPQHEDWSDPITLTPLADMRQPVPLNGDPSETVYALSRVIAAQRSPNGGLTAGLKPTLSPPPPRPLPRDPPGGPRAPGCTRQARPAPRRARGRGAGGGAGSRGPRTAEGVQTREMA